MENVSKALLIAAAMIIAVLIISLLVVAYNEISEYYKQEHEFIVVEQLQEFNKRFENYNRNNIRGSDMISLMNRVIDYNTTQVYQDGSDYERIKVTITMGKDILDQFRYETDGIRYGKNNSLLQSEITNVSDTGTDWENDKKLIAITNTPDELKTEAQKIGINNLTDTKLKQLSSNISNIFVDEENTDEWAVSQRLKRADVIENILGQEISINKENGKGIGESSTIIDTVKDMASQYYQYTQFKRAYFNCTAMNYNTDTGRVIEMKFELQTQKDTNGNTVVVFDK